MNKKSLSILLTLFLLILLAACSSLSLPGSATATPQANQNNPAGFAGQPVESKLAIGTLQLEDSELALTAEQATTLLPLWKAMKVLSSSETASQDEITALYAQIKESMTAEQVQAIEAMEMKPEETSALMEKYGIQAPAGGQQGGAMSGLTEDQRATRVAQFQAQGGAQGGRDGGQGGFTGGDVPPAGGLDGGNGGQGFVQPNAQGTAQPRTGMRAGRGGFNTLFVDPLIKLLEERSAA